MMDKMIEKLTGRNVKKLRIDNGKDCRSTEFENYFNEHSIVRHYTTIGTLQQNGVLKRMNRMGLQITCCMLFTVGLSKVFWAKAIHVACYLINRSLHSTIGC